MFLLITTVYFYFSGLALSIITKKEIEESIPLIFIVDGIIISIFSYLGNVYAGIYTSLYFIPILFILIIVYFFIKKKITIDHVVKKIKIRGLYIVLIFTYAFLLSKNTYFSTFDEYSFWGVRVFDMLKNNSIYSQNVFSQPIPYTEYPLFFSSIQCIFCFLGGGFQEPFLYFAMNSFCLSLFIYLIPYIENKYSKLYLPLYVILILISGICISIFNNNDCLFASIYVDYPMALFAAFVFYLAFSLNRNNIISIITLLISLLGLLITKQTALIFVLLIIVFLIISGFNRYSDKQKLFYIFFIAVSCVVCFIIGIFGLFRLKNDNALLAFNKIINSLIDGKTWERNVGKLFIDYLFNKPTSGGLISLPYFYYLLISCAIYYFASFFTIDNNIRKKNQKLSTLLFVGGIVWALCQLYFMYTLIGTEITQDRLILPSYERYMGSYLYMVIMTFFMNILYCLPHYSKPISLLLPLSVLLCINTSGITTLIPSNKPVGIITNSKTLKIINVLDAVPEKENLLIVEQYSDGYIYGDYIRYYYYKYDMEKPFTVTRFGTKDYNSQHSLDISLENYISYLNGYDYLYVQFADEQYINKYWKQSTDADIFVNGLYKINSCDQNRIDFQFIGFYE